MKKKICLLLVFASISLVFSVISEAGTLRTGLEKPTEEARAIWITRWNYKSPEDVAMIMQNLADHNFNMAVFQVRGNGTVFYKSKYEPWAQELTGGDLSTLGQDPGWDPLETAIKEARKHGIELHAWINTYPGWRGSTPPPIPNQLWNKHPEWFCARKGGQRIGLSDHYVTLAPSIPEVRDYLFNIYMEVVENYDVDGIHYDYVRYPGSNTSYDALSLAAYKRETGLAPEDNWESWSDWRRDTVTRLVRRIYEGTKERKPDVKVTGAVWGYFKSGYDEFLQDSHGWMAEGILDAGLIMGYTPDIDLFTSRVTNHIYNSHERHIYPGIGRMTSESLLEEIRLCREWGAQGNSIFAYNGLFSRHKPNEMAGLLLKTVYSQKAAIPEMPWKRSKDDDLTGPIVSGLEISPEFIREGDKLSVKAMIKDPSGVYNPGPGHDQAVHLRYSLSANPIDGKKIAMSKIPGDYNMYRTTGPIPAEQAGSEIYLRVYAYDNDHDLRGSADRALGYSEIATASVNYPAGRYKLSRNLTTLPECQFAETDGKGRLWIGNWGENRFVVLNPDGESASFSPIKGIRSGTRNIKFYSPSGLAYDRKRNLMYLTNDGGSEAEGDARGQIISVDPDTGGIKNVIHLEFRPGDIAVDDQGFLFVVEKLRHTWHLLDSKGKELPGSPFKGEGSISRGIAVSADSANVYIANSNKNTVYAWKGSIENGWASYREAERLTTGDAPSAVNISPDGYIYVSDTDGNRIQVFNSVGKRIEDIAGGFTKPRGVAFAPETNDIYIVPVNSNAGTSPLTVWTVKK